MKLKIIIDSISLLSPLTGIGRYTNEIGKRLTKDKMLDVRFFYGYPSKTIIKSTDTSNLKTFKSLINKSPYLKKIVRKLLFLTSNLIPVTYDLYWQPNFIPNSKIKSKKTVTSVHDFSFLHHKDFHPKERIKYFEKNFFSNIYKSDIIITFSEFTKQEILKNLKFKEEKIKVIYHGIDHNLFKIYTDIKIDFTLPEKFIFSVGSIEPRKNLINLLRAYTSLKDSMKKEYNLVLVGFKGWENQEIMTIIYDNKDYIHYLGYVNDDNLAKLYNLASLFVYPSFYEGFGLPPLEAMACGTPVITSNVSSLPEVGGNAVLYCNPHNIHNIKEKIEQVLSDKALQQEMIEKGLNRAKLFTWEKSTQAHIKVFKEVLKN